MIGLTVLLLLSAPPGPPAATAAAAVRPDSLHTLPEVRITAERPSAARRRLPTAFVTELATGASGRALETLSEVLAEAAGARVVQYGGLGAFSTVSLRGASPGQVGVFLDGLPLTSGAHGVVNLADLPATAIERIEVYRGLAPLGLGAAAPGGAVNLVTVSSPGPLEASVARGSFGTWEGRGTGGFRAGAVAGLVHAGYQGSTGDFRFHDDNATPANPDDDSLSVRVNNRFAAASALASLEVEAPGGVRARLRQDLFRKEQGIPGLGASPALASRLVLQRSITAAEAGRAADGAWPDLRLRAALRRERSRFRDAEGELGLGRHDTDDRFAGEDLALEAAWPGLPAGVALHVAGSVRRERAAPRDAADGLPDPPESARRGVGAAGRLEARPFGGRLLLHAARRWDRIEDRLRSTGVAGTARATDVAREVAAPQLGARWAAPGGVELRANWTDAERAPDFLELFGNQGSVLGNPLLRPERVESWDAGVAWTAPDGAPLRASIEWAHFASRARDLVVYMRNSQSSIRAQNVSRARIRGEEVSARLSGPAGLSVSASFTWQTAVDEGSVPFWRGKRLPQRPARQAYARLEWRSGGLAAAADLQTIGDNYLDRYNTRRVASRTLAGASLSFAFAPGGPRLVVEGKNLGDDQAADVAGFPLPGRSLFVSVRGRFGPLANRP